MSCRQPTLLPALIVTYNGAGDLQEGTVAGLYFEQFEAGRSASRHLVRRTVTETDNLLFSALTMNPAAVHLDAVYCKGTPYKERLVNSFFTLGLLGGQSVYDTTYGSTIASLGFEDVRFAKPVLIGDTLRATTVVVSKRTSQSRQDSGIVVFEHHAWNQRNEEVAFCRRSALMMIKPVA